MRKIFALIFVFLLPLSMACSHRSDSIPLTDAEPFLTHRMNPAHRCDPERISEDIQHCGACNRPCSPSDGDRCINGECRCGLSPSCREGTDCRYGRCYAPNLSGKVCEFDDQCDRGFACIEAHCTVIECAEEVCDGRDNDCDGLIDNTLEGTPLSEWCANGLSGPCRMGVRVCQYGEWSECYGSIPPIPETGTLRCDGIDNDCDGCVDSTLIGDECVFEELPSYDIVFVIDPSGSMTMRLRPILSAVDAYAASFSANPNFRFGIIRAPGAIDGSTELFLDFSEFEIFRIALHTISIEGGLEPSWDAIYELGHGDLPMSWRPEAIRTIILFTDESGQTFRYLRGLPPTDESQMCMSLTHGESLTVFSRPTDYGDFDMCARFLFNITTTTEEMINNLEAIISDPCG